MLRYFRDGVDFVGFRDVNVRKLRFEYEEREREAILSLLSGVLHKNPYLEEFEMVATNSEVFVNVNCYMENFEDFEIGEKLQKLTLIDSMLYNDRSKFLEQGTSNLFSLCINKSILNQKNFKLSDSL